MKHLLLLLLLSHLATFCSSAPATSSSSSPTSTSQPLKIFTGEGCSENRLYQSRFKSQVAAVAGDLRKIVEAVMASPEQSGSTYEQLAYFVDKFGARFTGTANLEAAIDFMLHWLKKEGHENVHGENVTVPVWTRGTEWAKMVKPRVKKLNILGLGYSVGTGRQELEAPVIVVKDWAELERRAFEVTGKIVVYNFHFESYGRSVEYREYGASRAAKHGARAALIRSVTPFSINSPHTGMQSYEKNVTQIPAVSITVEDAELLQRLADDGEEIVIRLYSENSLSPNPTTSRNVVSELVGSEHPDQVVLVSGHLDSWDVGQGAMDDGAGAFVSWRALSVVKQLGFKPKRTMRSVLWTAEEMGLLGATAYAKRHQTETAKWSIALESDIGTFTPNGITFSGTNHTAQCVLHQILELMTLINATRLVLSNEGSDVTLFIPEGVPIGSLDTRNERYFWFHHTDGDTMAVESKDDLDRCTALWTAVAYALAALDEQLPR